VSQTPPRNAAAGPHAREQAAVEAARRSVARAFAPNGKLAHAVAGFVARDSQRDMALAVFDAIVERATLVAEAGTGTGKTFAYLVPALLAGGKVLVSTGTKTLQDQVYGKDLAAVTRALSLRVECALLKGRQNYVCLHRLERAEQQAQLPTAQDAAQLRAVLRFARTTTSGDLAELAEVPEGTSLRPLVTSTRENCLGSECPRFDACFVYKARRAAQQADVVVVNHHLFLADVALRDDAIREFLPTVDTVVLDEAHQLPRIAAEFFGTAWSLAQLAELTHDARAVGLAHAPDGAPWIALTQAVEQTARELRLQLAQADLEPGARVAVDRIGPRAALAQAIAAIDSALAALASALAANQGRDTELDALLPRVTALRAQVADWCDVFADGAADTRRRAAASTDDSDAEKVDDVIRWVGVSTHGAQFNTTPLAPGAAFARVRAACPTQAWILTSATLTVAQRFESFIAETGLVDARTQRWDSPFDFARQALLYLPRPMPSPLAQDFAERVADLAWPVIAAAGGRAFVLCTTLRAVERVAARLRARMREAGVELPLLVQGTTTRRALLDAFRCAGNAVLVGSVSFWEGIDVRGGALSLVVIDKLPFAPPDDPVVAAKIRRLRALGRNPFVEYQLPQAVTLLKQGVGRLIRDEADRGVLMILDERVLTKPYGKTVLASLPPFARTRSEAEACAFFRPEQRGTALRAG
jgi:ATP-dependent DNA helicase DinG